MPIRPLPPAPTRDDPTNFAEKGDALLGALPGFVDDCNALEQAMLTASGMGTSGTALTISSGAKVLVSQPDRSWRVGMSLYLLAAASPTDVMVVRITAYNDETGALSADVLSYSGAGTYNNWIIGLSVPQVPITGAMMQTTAIADRLGYTPVSPLDLAAAVSAGVQVGIALASPIGQIMAVASMDAPACTLLVDGKSIGSAASGATARADADVQQLYDKLWAMPGIPIQTSGGIATVRGANAAADWVANKRLRLFTPDGGAFLRMWAPGQTVDAGRVAGSDQAPNVGDHDHTLFADNSGSGPNGQVSSLNGGDFTVGGDARAGGDLLNNGGGRRLIKSVSTGTPHPYNLAVPHYIRFRYT